MIGLRGPEIVKSQLSHAIPLPLLLLAMWMLLLLLVIGCWLLVAIVVVTVRGMLPLFAVAAL
jgi:hypothetical protein